MQTLCFFKAGAVDRLGKTIDGTTVCDFDSEEIKRKISINAALASFDYEGTKINLIDTPGLFDFAGEMEEGIYASDTVMITVSAKSGVKTGTKKSLCVSCQSRKIKDVRRNKNRRRKRQFL